MRLGLLGGVVLAVLLEIAPFASSLDAGCDRRAPAALQLVQLFAQALAALRRSSRLCPCSPPAFPGHGVAGGPRLTLAHATGTGSNRAFPEKGCALGREAGKVRANGGSASPTRGQITHRVGGGEPGSGVRFCRLLLQAAVRPWARPGASGAPAAPTHSVSTTVYVSAVNCKRIAAGQYAGQRAGAQLFGSPAVHGTTQHPFDFAGFYSYCNGQALRSTRLSS